VMYLQYIAVTSHDRLFVAVTEKSSGCTWLSAVYSCVYGNPESARSLDISWNVSEICMFFFFLDALAVRVRRYTKRLKV
jgi:hypothetical protein